VFTYPNADLNGSFIINKIKKFVEQHEKAHLVINLGTQGYFSLMAHSSAMVGNSSSGIIEAASFKLPVVNIGNRQRGRIREKNVINVGYRKKEISEGIMQATSQDFSAGLQDLVNPYGDGNAAIRILGRLKEVAIDEKLVIKEFHDIG
jgi:UDP-N-acetylglucosamine 2-epimerase